MPRSTDPSTFTPSTWEEIQASIATGGCPGCGGRPGAEVCGVSTVHKCQGCGGIFGSCTQLEAIHLVFPQFALPEDQPGADERAILFDLDVTDASRENGGGRRHGFFDPLTRRITQTG